MTQPVGGTAGIGMSATPIAGALGAGTSGSTSPVDQFGKDTFLKLLVAQLKYQNPMDPSNGAEFLAQTAQFTQVEKLGDLSTKLSQVVSGDQLLGATSLLGRTVSWSDNGTTQSGVVTGTHLGSAGPVLRVGNQDVPLSAVSAVTV